MRKLFVAIRAFKAIIKDKPHIFVDEYCHSIFGYRDECNEFINRVTEACNDDIEQTNVLSEANKILNS